MKIRKNALMLSVIAMLLIPAFAAVVKPSFGMDPTKITVDTIDAPGMAVGEIFAVNIYVWNVEAMFGYAVRVSYDTALLETTGNWGAYDPFTFGLGQDFSPGIVTVASTMVPPELYGWYWEGQYPIAWIEFRVLDPQASPFILSDTELSDIHGMPIPHTTENGWFRNLEGAPIAWFAPPAPAQALEDVTFTSLSWDPYGTIADADIQWDFGDGGTATGGTVTHQWGAEGTYPVTLTVKNDAGIFDTQIHTMGIIPPPLAGAIAVRGRPTQKYLDFTKYGDHKEILKGWAKNLDLTREELVRVDLEVWSAVYEMHLGAVATPNQWLGPGILGTFQGEFDMMDPKWMFVQGAARAGFDEFTVYVNVYYADFFYNGDPNNPHWTQVEGAPEVAYTFGVHETKPVPVPVATQIGPNTVYLDGSGSYDVDSKWGDYIAGYRWLVYDIDGNLIYQLFGDPKTVTLDLGYYDINLRVEDSFGTRRSAWTDITVV